MSSNINRFIFFIIFFALIDQLSKLFIINYFDIDVNHLATEALYVINDYLNLYIVWNKGFAFGLFQNDMNFINNIYICLMIIIAVGLFIYGIKINKKIYFFSLSLIIGGAIGNLIDRYFYNAVLDFIDLHYANLHWYVFNIADITITIGCILIIILEIISTKKKEQNGLKN